MSSVVGITLFTEDDVRLSLGLPIPGGAITTADIGIKAGKLIPANFTAGVASVAFTTAYSNANYSITLDAGTTNDAYALRWENKTVSGFDVDLGSTNLAGLAEVTWQAMPNLE